MTEQVDYMQLQLSHRKSQRLMQKKQRAVFNLIHLYSVLIKPNFKIGDV